jgi:hypothetical protein
MIRFKYNFAALWLTAGALFFAACGDKSAEDAALPEAVVIPDAPDAAIQALAHELAKGNGGILWRAMPVSYQGDINALIHLFGTKIDAEIYDKSFALIGRLSQMAQKQQVFILNTSLAESTADEQAKWEQALPAVITFVDTLVASDLGSSAGLQSFAGRAFFDTTVSKLLQSGSQLSEASGAAGLADLADVVVSLVQSDEAEATLLVSLPRRTSEEAVFAKVEGRWIPVEMSSTWEAGVAAATAKLEAISNEDLAAQKPKIIAVLAMVEGVLTQIDSAETQEQFDQALQGAMMPLMAIMMMGQGMGAPSAP